MRCRHDTRVSLRRVRVRPHPAGSVVYLKLDLDASIHEALHRMTETVAAVQHVRRIVLTDYVAGVKMLDLRKSVELETS